MIIAEAETFANMWHFQKFIGMGVGSGGYAPLDFRTSWYKYSKQRLNSAIFRPVFAIFRSFFPLAPLEET